MSSDYPANLREFHLREMRIEDIQQVHAIDEVSFNLPWPESAYRYEIKENPHSLVLVAEKASQAGENQIAGLIVAWLIVDEAHIATIAVHPDYRGQGLGSQLLAEALRRSIQRGMLSATLEVRLGNQTAQRMYRTFKFEVVGRRMAYYRDNQEDALIMTVEGLGDKYMEWLDSGEWTKTRYE